MANNGVQGVLQLIAIASCCYGMFLIYGLSSTLLSLVYNGMWFILGFLSNLTGIISIVIYYLENDETMETSHHVLQYHYLCSWLAVVVGYPTLVTQFWMNYYPSYLSQILVALSVLPMVAWAYRNNNVIVTTTQLSTSISIIAHTYISYLASNVYGLIGAGVMVLNLTSLSMPTRYNLFGFSSRESFVIGLAACSYIFALGVSHMVTNPMVVPSLLPW